MTASRGNFLVAPTFADRAFQGQTSLHLPAISPIRALSKGRIQATGRTSEQGR